MEYAQDGWKTHLDALGQVMAQMGNENWDTWADLDGSNNLQTRYLRGDVVDQLFAREDSAGNVFWTLTDRLGSIRTVIDNSANVKDQIFYDGWGNPTGTNSFAGRYLWTGRDYDTETNFQYNRARYYDPHTGRWISQDPLGFDAGDSNLYRYVKNQPFSKADPNGLLSSELVTLTFAKEIRNVGENLKVGVPNISNLTKWLKDSIKTAANYPSLLVKLAALTKLSSNNIKFTISTSDVDGKIKDWVGTEPDKGVTIYEGTTSETILLDQEIPFGKIKLGKIGYSLKFRTANRVIKNNPPMASLDLVADVSVDALVYSSKFSFFIGHSSLVCPKLENQKGKIEIRTTIPPSDPLQRPGPK